MDEKRQAKAARKKARQAAAVANTFYLQYADGTPYYGVGTTAYQWTSVDQDIQQQTLDTLSESPFNKIRMCVFPKFYRYGNDTEPWAYPFHRDGETNDLTRPSFDFFRNFDQRGQQLRDMGIQADVILFHPYDQWGYERMGHENDDRYLRYMIAKPGHYYLAYVANAGKTIRLELPGDSQYRVDRIDTWDMHITPLPDVDAGMLSYETQNKYEALRVRVKD